jgi:SAM-dependent methyltransferase
VGIDVPVQPSTRIHFQPFDGVNIPYPDASIDAVMFVNVLHHTADPHLLLREATCVGKMSLIKDHFHEGFFDKIRLRFMDWVGDAHHGVALPFNYWSRRQWSAAFGPLGLKTSEMRMSLGLHPAPASWIFERGLHFVARLQRGDWLNMCHGLKFLLLGWGVIRKIPVCCRKRYDAKRKAQSEYR